MKILRRSEPPFLVELTVVRQVSLGNQRQQVTFLNHRCAVQQQVAHDNGQTHNRYHIQFPGKVQQHHHCRLRLFQ